MESFIAFVCLAIGFWFFEKIGAKAERDRRELIYKRAAEWRDLGVNK